MKGIYFVFLLSAIAINGNAQIKKVYLSESKIDDVQCKYVQAVDLDKGDTTMYVSLIFQNARYKTITDFKAIILMTKYPSTLSMPGDDSTQVYNFLKDLKAAFAEMGNKSSIKWSRDGYTIGLHDFSNSLYLYESENDGNGCTLLSKKHVEKLINWIEGLGIVKQ